MKIDTFIVIPFGAPEFTVEEKKDTIAYEEGYKAALMLYRLENNE